MTHPNLLRKGAEWLTKTRTRHMTEQVVYQVVSSSITIPATVYAGKFEVIEVDAAFPVGDEPADFIIKVCDLVIDGERIEPATGHRIILGDVSEGRVYEVMPIVGEKCWRFSDSFQTEYRIHAKYVGTQPPQP